MEIYALLGKSMQQDTHGVTQEKKLLTMLGLSNRRVGYTPRNEHGQKEGRINGYLHSLQKAYA